MVRGQKECSIRRRSARLSEKCIDGFEMLLGLRGIRRPGVHRIVCCMHIKTLDIRPMFQDVDGGSKEPVVDLAAVNGRSRSQPINPLRRCYLCCEREGRPPAQE